jgi:hypothetical protein
MANSNDDKLESINKSLKIIIGLIIVSLLLLGLYYNKEIYNDFNKKVFNIDNDNPKVQ